MENSSIIIVLPFVFSIIIEILGSSTSRYWSEAFTETVESAGGERTDTGWIIDALSYYLAAQLFWIGLAMTFVTVLVLVVQNGGSFLIVIPPIFIAILWYKMYRPDDFAVDAVTGAAGFRVPGILTIILNFIYIIIFI